jgi:hypothetical protein
MRALVTILFLAVIGAKVAAICPSPASAARRSPYCLRAASICCGLVFPESDEPSPFPRSRLSQGSTSEEGRRWRKGKLPDSSVTYWWREGQDGGEPEIAMTAPPEDWKVGMLSDGRQYLWREGDNPDDPDIKMLGDAVTQSNAGWRVGTLPSGRRYLWRGEAHDPEVRLWEQSYLDSGKPFWYTADGAVSLTDPFDLERGYTEL